jgi:hypothetical protein
MGQSGEGNKPIHSAGQFSNDPGKGPGDKGGGKGNSGTPGDKGPGGGGKDGNEKGSAGASAGIPGTVKQGTPAAVEVPVIPGLDDIKEEKKQTKKKKSSGGDKAAKKDLSRNIAALLQTSSDLVALRAGDLWKLDPEEVQSIADPLAGIIARHDLTEAAGEYGDYIGLALALGLTIIPRVLIAQAANKQGGGVKLGAGAGTKGADKGPTRENNAGSGNAPSGSGNVKKLLPGLG